MLASFGVSLLILVGSVFDLGEAGLHKRVKAGHWGAAAGPSAKEDLHHSNKRTAALKRSSQRGTSRQPMALIYCGNLRIGGHAGDRSGQVRVGGGPGSTGHRQTGNR